MRVMLAAGGTGGHLLPGLAVGKELRARGHGVHFILRSDPAAQELVAKEGFSSSSFHLAGLPRTFGPKLLLYPFLLANACLTARRVLKREKPDVVAGMGGYVSVPLGLAAAWADIPLVLHEQNTVAGLANRLLSRWADAVGLSFEETRGLRVRKGRLTVTGLPLRPDLTPKPGPAARKALGLDPDAPTLLIFGGSQGAAALNRWMRELLPLFKSNFSRWQFIHMTGKDQEEAMRAAYAAAGRRAFVRGFTSDMATAYAAADYVLCRSGAGTVMELVRMGKRALLVPYPSATDGHQESNARAFQKMGQGEVLLEKEFSAERWMEIFRRLPPADHLRSETEGRLSRIGPEAAQAAARFADLVEQIQRERVG